MQQEKPKRLFTTAEAAHFLGFAWKTVYNKLNEGTFPIQPKRYGGKLLFERKGLERFADSL